MNSWPSWLPHTLTLVISVIVMYAKSAIEEHFARRAKAARKKLKKERKKERDHEPK